MFSIYVSDSAWNKVRNKTEIYRSHWTSSVDGRLTASPLSRWIDADDGDGDADTVILFQTWRQLMVRKSA